MIIIQKVRLHSIFYSVFENSYFSPRDAHIASVLLNLDRVHAHSIEVAMVERRADDIIGDVRKRKSCKGRYTGSVFVKHFLPLIHSSYSIEHAHPHSFYVLFYCFLPSFCSNNKK